MAAGRPCTAPPSAAREEITQFLGDHGTNFDVTTKKEGWTALRIADGVFVGGTVKRADETAALIRKLMTRARPHAPRSRWSTTSRKSPKP